MLFKDQKSSKKQCEETNTACSCKLISINPSFLRPYKASAGCYCLKITISPPLSCLINNSDVQFRNFAINLLKYCWRMLIVMPVAIKTHLHNVCAKTIMSCWLCRRENAPSDGMGVVGETFARWVLQCADGGTTHTKIDVWGRVCTHQGACSPFQMKLICRLLVLALFLFILADREIWALLR